MIKKLTKNQIAIIELFKNNLFLKATILEIAKKLEKAYPKIYEAIKQLEQEEILKLEKIGKASLCSINLNEKTQSWLSFLEEQEAYTKNIPNIKKILDFEDFSEDIIIITGSYAKQKQTKNSDMDLVIITKEATLNKQKLIENKTSLLIPEIHPIALSEKDFTKMLLDKEENFGKEIFKYHFIFRKANRYYQLLKEVINHGFGD